MDAILRHDSDSSLSRQYWAFISYSNRDARRWAVPLRKRLEGYRIPRALVGKSVRDDRIPARLSPVFRDREELVAGPDLPRQIQDALKASRYLIVVCSPRSQASEYVGQEIRWFKQLGRADRIFAYIVEGEPADCFRDELLYALDESGTLNRNQRTEPLAADARTGRDGKDAVLKLVAGMLQVSFDELKRRDLQRQQRWLLGLSVSSLTILVVLAMLTLWALNERDRANQQTSLAQTNLARANQLKGIAEANERLAIEQRGVAEANGQLANERRLRIRRNLYAAQMMRASRDYDANFVARTKETLAAWRPNDSDDADLRGFEWYYLWRLTHAERHILPGQNSPATAVAWSPDGCRLACASEEEVALPFPFLKYTSSKKPLSPRDRVRSGTIRIWQAEDGQQLATLSGHAGSVHAVAFCPTENVLASAGDDGTIRLWNAETFQEQKAPLAGHQGIVYGLAFSADGRWLASAGQDHAVRIWDWNTDAAPRTLAGHEDSVFCVAFSRDGVLASCGYDNTIRLWNADNGEPGLVLRAEDSIPTAVAFHPEGRELASTGADRTLRIWDVDKGTARLTLGGMPNLGTGLSYSSNGRFLAVASWDQTVNVRDASTGQLARRYRGHISFVNAVAFSPTSPQLASASHDHSARIWDASVDPEETQLASLGGAVLSVAFSPDGQRIAAASDRNPRLKKTDDISVMDSVTGQEVCRLIGHQGSIHGVTFHPDGRRLASGGYAADEYSGEIKLWDIDTQQILQSWSTPRQVAAVAFSPDGQRLASGCRDGMLTLWNPETGQSAQTFTGHMGGINSVAWSADGSLLATGSYDKTVRVWEAESGKTVWTLQGHEHLVRGVAFSPEGRSLASASWDATVRLWDLTSGQATVVLHGHNGFVYDVKFSPDGERLFSCAGNSLQSGEIKLWDARTHEELLALRGHRSFIYCLSLDAQGERLISGGNEGTLILWHAPKPKRFETTSSGQPARLEN